MQPTADNEKRYLLKATVAVAASRLLASMGFNPLEVTATEASTHSVKPKVTRAHVEQGLDWVIDYMSETLAPTDIERQKIQKDKDGIRESWYRLVQMTSSWD